MSDKPIELWLQTFRFWRCARTIRHGQVDPVTNTRRQLMTAEKIEEIDFWIKGVTRPVLLQRYQELRTEVLSGKEYNQDESIQHAKTAS